MCGITGFIDFNRKSSAEILQAMAKSIIHRGPDDAGSEFFSTEQAHIGLGFRRLAILDLSPSGHQPMLNPITGQWIVFNGEVYNFREIKKELEGLGHSFVSTGDTEVILKSFQQWGKTCVNRFIGMFAILIYDPNKNRVTCYRDRAGVKPFYYYFADNVFLFGSELKTFHQHPSFKPKQNLNALALFFKHGYISAPHTIFENTYKLNPGSMLELDLNTKELTTSSYWNILDYYNKPKLNLSFNEALEQTEDLLVSAFNYRLIADVPVGVFLSGGYDSSCVAALLQKNNSGKINTYTIGFEDENFNEANYAKAVADYLGTSHHEYYCTFKEAKELIPKLADIYDEPFGDSSAIPTTLVSSIARKHVTVALSADGGDELFAGYPRHLKSVNQIQRLSKIPGVIKSTASALVPTGSQMLAIANRKAKLKEILQKNQIEKVFDVINQTYASKELSQLLKKEVFELDTPFTSQTLSPHTDILDHILALEYNTYLPDDILQKVDRASMSVSLEGREPFLDHRLSEFVAQLPSDYKMKDGKQKILLKEIVHRHIPRELMERKKMGFGVPVKDWCRTDLKDVFMEVMSDKALDDSGVFETKEIALLRDQYLKEGIENFERIWFIFMYQMWFKKWM